jgi:Flp pilus assembly protein TadG
MKKQHGAAMVEFALIALLFFMLLFGIIEFARAFFTYNTLVEATRRGARVAAVCPISAAGTLQAKQVTVFDSNPDGTSAVTGLLGLSTANVQVSYYDTDSNNATPSPSWIAGPLADNSTTYNTITFVRVELQNVPNFLQLSIPLFPISISLPPIQTILPSQSLGRMSFDNPVTTRCCYNTCP